MGQSTPTTTMALDTFQERYAAFRAELHPREARCFDRLVEAARRHSNAINRRPHLDFERPVMLAMLMEAMREVDELRKELAHAREDLREADETLVEAGLRVRRPWAALARGQRRL